MKKDKLGEIRPEYKRSDLGQSVRGKHFKEYREGTNIVLLSPDVAAYFNDDDSVNEALRALIRVAGISVKKAKRTSAKNRSRQVA